MGHYLYNYKLETEKRCNIKQTAKTVTETSFRTSMENIAFFKYKNTVVMESVKFKQLFYELMCIELS